MATTNKDFRIKNGLVVEGTTSTVNGNQVLTTASSIDALSDVVISTPTLNQVLLYNGTNWVNSSSAGGGTTTNPLTIGTGLSGTSFNGSAAVTIAIDSTVATLTDTQTLTNKTLTSPTINTPLFTLSTTTSTIEGRIAWDSTTDKIIVGDGTAAREFASSTLVTNANTGTIYTFVLADKDKMVELSNASAITASIPTNSSVAYPVGTQINIIQTGAGQVTIAAVTPGTTTINATPGFKLRAQWSSATLIKRDTDTWVAIGDLAE